MFSVMFILPVSGGSGGAHSVMQEADAMWNLGVPTSIACNASNVPNLRRAYRDLKIIQNHVIGYTDPASLGALIKERGPSVVVATTNQSVHVLAQAIKDVPPAAGTKLAYYIQDYEPLFYAKGSDDWLTAYSSFGLIPNLIHFAKTQWLQEVVEANHNIQVFKVDASIDHSVYYPRIAERMEKREKIVISAMLRPATPRRAPRRTVRIMNTIRHRFADQVTCMTFGCNIDDLKDRSLRLAGVEHAGVLKRDEVGEFFRSADLFLDLSDFQAFGRTAIEAMSCGTIAVVPAHGGVYEFLADGQNGFIADTRSDHSILAAVQSFLHMSAAERQEMTMKAISAGFHFSPERAALSEIRLFLGA
jgi:glycosyltransferase involved in cell wall biosynthesis